MISKYLALILLITGVQSRFIIQDIVPVFIGVDVEEHPEAVQELQDIENEDSALLGEYNGEHHRLRRQVHGVLNTNPDGSANIMGKIPLTGNDKNMLSAIGSASGVTKDGHFAAAGGGLAFDNVNGHGLSLTGKHIPAFGDQLTAAGKANLFHNDHHDLTANAFATRNMPNKFPNAPNFNTVGGGLDYTFNNKLGASLGVAHTDLFKKTDVSAMGNYNLFKDKTQSLDFNGGATRSFSPFIPKSRWEPTFGMSYSRYF